MGYKKMIINEKTHKAKRKYTCMDCGKSIEIGDKYSRFFGMAHKGDKPYEVLNCMVCYTKYKDFNKRKDQKNIMNKERILKFKEYVSTYPDDHSYEEITFIKDMIYGIGLAFDEDKYKWHNGYKLWIKQLIKILLKEV
jgi:hypothetical protein